MEELYMNNWGGGCGCRPRCPRPACPPQTVFAPAPNFGYNVQHPVLVPNEPSHRVDFHPEFWQWGQQSYGGMPVEGPARPMMGPGGQWIEGPRPIGPGGQFVMPDMGMRF